MSKLDSLLRTKKTTTNSTHTRIADPSTQIYGGAYNFGSNESAFYDTVYKEVVIGGKPEFLTEKQRTDGTFVIDLDFRYKPEITTRQYTADDIETIVCNLLEEIKDVFIIDASFTIYVMEKPTVNRLSDKTKDGVHLLFTFDADNEAKLEIRKRIIQRPHYLSGITNSLEDVYDISIFKGTTNWMVYGCCKPNHDVYRVIKAYNCMLDPTDNEWITSSVPIPNPITPEIFNKLSVRTPCHKFVTKHCYSQSSQKCFVQQHNKCFIPAINDKYINLLFNVIKNEPDTIDFNTWFQIAGILKCNGYDFDVLYKYTNNYNQNDIEKDLKTESIWRSINTQKQMSIYGLQNIAKRINPAGYFEWLSKYNESISIDTLQKGANDVCIFISNSLKDKLVFSKGVWYMCNNNSIWIKSNDPSAIIVSAIQTEIDKLMKTLTDTLNDLSDDDEKRKDIRKQIKCIADHRTHTNREMNSYIKLLKTYLGNDAFTSLLDNNPYQVAYTNGMLCLKTLKFREGLMATDYLTKTISFEYKPSTPKQKQTVYDELKKICNNNQTHLDWYLSILGYTMTGDPSRLQEFYYFRGQKACNGKSVIFEALCDIIPNYFLKISSNTFEKKNPTRHKEIARWRGIRCAWTNELSTTEQDPEFIKDVSDGTKIPYSVMYGIVDEMPITFKPFIVSNHTITMKMDSGVMRRMRIGQFDSDFIDGLEKDDPVNCKFKLDHGFGVRLRGELKDALLNLMFDYSKMFVDNNYQVKPYPIEWISEVEDCCTQNDAFKDWFETNFTVGPKCEIKKYRLNSLMKSNGFTGIKFTDHNKKNRWGFKSDNNAWYGFEYKNGF